MTVPDAVRTCFRNYITFSGRAPRAEFWKFILFWIVADIGLIIVNSAVLKPTFGNLFGIEASGLIFLQLNGTTYSSGLLGLILTLVMLLPWLSVTWRRMHDIGMPGYLPFAILFGWAALAIVLAWLGVVGPLVLIAGFLIAAATNIFYLASKSDPGANAYGGGQLDEVFE